jgi:CDP-diacylglycerol--glycerol-3-phosphate 3-phosphatidyltransferase
LNGSLVSPATRQRVRDLATPVARGLGRLGLTPNALTVIGFLGTCAAAIAAATQAWLLAGILVLAFGIFDLFDGALARATGRATRLGAFLDSTFDRAGEAIVYLGIAAGAIAFDATSPVLAVAAAGAAFMVSYARAKAESLGFSSGTGMAAVGFAPREVRTLLLGIGLMATGIAGGAVDCVKVGPDLFRGCIETSSSRAGPGILAGTLALITILATITSIQRILHVRAQSREG